MKKFIVLTSLLLSLIFFCTCCTDKQIKKTPNYKDTKKNADKMHKALDKETGK